MISIPASGGTDGIMTALRHQLTRKDQDIANSKLQCANATAPSPPPTANSKNTSPTHHHDSYDHGSAVDPRTFRKR